MHITLSALLLSSSVAPVVHAKAANTKQSVLVKKLRKAWENNWVKAGIVTTGCALIYALGTKLTAVPAVCSAKPDCGMCNQVSTFCITNNKLLWKVVGILSGIATLGFGYAYYNAQQEDAQDMDDSATTQEPSNASGPAHFDDDFFALEDAQEEYEEYNTCEQEDSAVIEENEEEYTTFNDIEVVEQESSALVEEEMTELPAAQVTQSFL